MMAFVFPHEMELFVLTSRMCHPSTGHPVHWIFELAFSTFDLKLTSDLIASSIDLEGLMQLMNHIRRTMPFGILPQSCFIDNVDAVKPLAFATSSTCKSIIALSLLFLSLYSLELLLTIAVVIPACDYPFTDFISDSTSVEVLRSA